MNVAAAFDLAIKNPAPRFQTLAIFPLSHFWSLSWHNHFASHDTSESYPRMLAPLASPPAFEFCLTSESMVSITFRCLALAFLTLSSPQIVYGSFSEPSPLHLD
jgi:hypothetical protein